MKRTFFNNEQPRDQTAGHTKNWGPQYWYFIHMAAVSYSNNPTPEMKSVMKHFLIGIPVFLPCGACKKHSEAFLTEKRYLLDWAVSNRTNLFEFTWAFHNHVNALTAKPQISLAKAKEDYHFFTS